MHFEEAVVLKSVVQNWGFLNLFLNIVFGKSSQNFVLKKVKCLANIYKCRFEL